MSTVASGPLKDQKKEERKEVITDIGNDDTLASFSNIKDKKWDDAVFKNVSLIEDLNPLKSNPETTRVVWVDPLDPEMDRGIQREFREKYPDLQEIKKDFEILEQITKTGGQEVRHTKVIKAKQGKSEDELWENLVGIRANVDTNEEIAFHDATRIPTQILRKMAEFILKRSQIKLLICIKKRRKATKRKWKEKHMPWWLKTS